MVDKNPSFFGPVSAEGAAAPDAWSFSDLQLIQAQRLEADLEAALHPAFPKARRFETMGYFRSDLEADHRPPLAPGEHLLPNGVRIIIS